MSEGACGLVRCLVWLLVAVCFLAGCDEAREPAERVSTRTADNSGGQQSPGAGRRAAATSPPIVAAARAQVGRTLVYDGSYVALAYPGGDVPIDRGVCTDVVIRALRDASGMDLQKLVHEDMTAAFSEYPKTWGLSRPDRNIDHRRVPNLRRYFERKGYAMAVTRRKEDYRPGDLLTCTVPRNRPHIMIVSDAKTADGAWLVIHNIGRGTVEEPRLFDFPITGHYRIPSRPLE